MTRPSLPGGLANGAYSLGVLARAGVLAPPRPDQLLGLGRSLAYWGPTLAAGFASGAVRHPKRLAVVDDEGQLSYAELDRASSALASALRKAGLRPGARVAVLCRNSAGFVIATIALAKLGADLVLLNTSFAGPQIVEVTDREGSGALICDAEFAELPEVRGLGLPTWVVEHAGATPPPGLPTLRGAMAAGGRREPPPPRRVGRVVILTSGTTGTPKGANRGNPRSLEPAVALLSRMPLRAGETVVVAAPLFHSWGFAHLGTAAGLNSTLVLSRAFDPEATLAAIAAHRAAVLAVVPVMMQRILELPEDVRRRYETSSLRVVASSGSALPGGLATRFMDAFGDVLYNLYGSTEAAWASIATPADLRAAPGTAGRPPRGTTVKILDERGAPVAAGTTGRIFVGNGMAFDGYTGGGTKESVAGLMSTGDLGHFDDEGRLFVEGRDDEMVVSGGENVFPREVEDLLARHPTVADVAVVGVPDDTFGQRLAAFVVPVPGAELTEDEVRSHVRANLARFKVPRDVTFVDQIPRNATGKILKRVLAERA